MADDKSPETDEVAKTGAETDAETDAESAHAPPSPQVSPLTRETDYAAKPGFRMPSNKRTKAQKRKKGKKKR